MIEREIFLNASDFGAREFAHVIGTLLFWKYFIET
jgi:hypothetical protein